MTGRRGAPQMDGSHPSEKTRTAGDSAGGPACPVGRERSHGAGPPGRAGFSLIEALVALAVLAGVATAALMLFSLGTERNARATERLRATIAAEAILSRVGLDVPLQVQTLSGRLKDGARFSLEVAPATVDGRADGDLLAVTVKVRPRRWRGAPVELTTLKLARAL
jgi:general secretion pathway protein I